MERGDGPPTPHRARRLERPPMTVTEILVEVPAELDAQTLREFALIGIGAGLTADQVRAWPKGSLWDARNKQPADEIDSLTGRGVNRRAASRACRELSRKNPAYRDYRYTEQDAREAAMIYLAAGITSASLRESTALRGTPEERRESA